MQTSNGTHDVVTRDLIPKLDCDVAVVGGGVAGLSAALQASSAGAEVVVLEKGNRKNRGGSSAIADAQIRYPHPADEYCGVGQTRDDFQRAFIEQSLGRANRDLVDELVSNAEAGVEWLASLGVQWEIGYPHPAGYRRQPKGGGWALMEQLYAQAERSGVTVAYETPGERLLMNSAGRVIGVRALEPDGYVDVVSRGGVVIATGGFQANVEMRVRYLGPQADHLIVRGSSHSTGDGLRMALDSGAQSAGQWGDFHSAVIDARSRRTECGVTAIYIYQLGIIVDPDGQRFVDEGHDFRDHTYVRISKTILNHKDGRGFVVFDSKPSIDDPDGWRRAVRSGHEPFVGATLDELARQLKIPSGAFEETVSTYNAACPVGACDPNRLDGLGTSNLSIPKSNWARPIDTPPYVAYPVTGGITFTFGGLKTNRRAEVIGRCGRPIPGLYVAGEAAGELYYYNYVGATSVLRGVVFGRIAGAEAARQAHEMSDEHKRDVLTTDAMSTPREMAGL